MIYSISLESWLSDDIWLNHYHEKHNRLYSSVIIVANYKYHIGNNWRALDNIRSRLYRNYVS